MPGLVSKPKKHSENTFCIEPYRVYSITTTNTSTNEEHSSFSDDEVMNQPGMVRLMGYLENMPVAERVPRFTIRLADEEPKNESETGVQETEEARRTREIEEDRRNYMNRFFR